MVMKRILYIVLLRPPFYQFCWFSVIQRSRVKNRLNMLGPVLFFLTTLAAKVKQKDAHN